MEMLAAKVISNKAFWACILKWFFIGTAIYTGYTLWAHERRQARIAELTVAELEATPVDAGVPDTADKWAARCRREKRDKLLMQANDRSLWGLTLPQVRLLAVSSCIGAAMAAILESSIYNRGEVQLRAAEACAAAPDILAAKMEATADARASQLLAEQAYDGAA